MADKRAFAKFDVGYLDNPKMLDVLDASSSAILMHFASVLYCAQHLTDGVVASKAMQRKTGGTDDDAQILIESGLWHAPGHACESCPQPPAGKVYVHDFLEHNRDSAEAKRVSEKRSKAAKARWEGEASRMQSASQEDDVCNAERERKRETEAKASEGASQAPPAPKRAARASRIPEGWTPSDDLANAMAAECPQVDQRAEHRKFVDYWTAKSGKDATKADWNATYRNWIRRAAEKAPATGNRATDRMMAGYQAMASYQGPQEDPWTRKALGA